MQRYLSLYFNPTGRVSRGAYWLNAWVILPIASIAIIIIISFLTDSLTRPLTTSPLTIVVTFISYIAILWSALVLQIKRLHDQDKDGWWVIFNFIPVLGQIILGFLPGTKGPNRYGPQPHWFN